MPCSCQRSWPSTEYAGRGAGDGNAAESVGLTTSRDNPAAATTSPANSYQDVFPEDVVC